MKRANEKKEPHRARVRASAGEAPMDASRGAVEAQLEELKEKLLAPIVRSVGNTMLVSELRWVANEAAALAWFTVCPILVLPLLLEEKIRAALERWERQHQLLECRVRSAECGVRNPRTCPVAGGVKVWTYQTVWKAGAARS